MWFCMLNTGCPNIQEHEDINIERITHQVKKKTRILFIPAYQKLENHTDPEILFITIQKGRLLGLDRKY